MNEQDNINNLAKMKDNILKFNFANIIVKQKDEYAIEIPVFQRSLVWKPKQVELLWDSILRGFPVGSFTLSESDTKESNCNKVLYIMDGQQRFNSISLGFDNFVLNDENDNKEDPTMVLWLDLAPENIKNTSRKYWIKTTTKYHPWGYQNNDDCSVLTAEERRSALKDFGKEGKNIYKDSISLKETWPYKAKLPIPLYIFLETIINSEINSEEDFIKSIIEKIEKIKTFLPEKWIEFFYDEKIEKKIKELGIYQTLKSIENYSISGTLLYDEIINKETNEEKHNSDIKTDLEVLFNRLGTGGTQITQAELIYSAITAYWGEIKFNNENLARKYMPAHNLIILAFRLISTLCNSPESLAAAPSLSRIRSLKEDNEFKNKLVELYKHKFNDILEKVSTWISGKNEDKTPTILQLDLYKNHSDLILLLLYISYNELEVDEAFIRAYIFYVIWFAEKGKEHEVIKTTFNRIKNEQKSTNGEILKSLFESVYQENIIPLISLNNLFYDNSGNKRDLSSQQKYVYNSLSYNKELLLFAQRKYLNKTFPNYKPISRFDWEEHNRPWDFDHIVPQKWVSNKRGNSKCKDYLWTIGNFAALPFEINREKNANANWEVYEENKKELFFDKEWLDEVDENIVYDVAKTNKFIEFCKKRMNLIFNDCHESLFKHIKMGLSLTQENEQFIPQQLITRKKFFVYLKTKDEFKSFKFRYVDENSKHEIELNENKILDWSRRWISFGYEDKDENIMIAICSMDGNTYEIGFRKLSTDERTRKDMNREMLKVKSKGQNLIDESSNQWWYSAKEVIGEEKAEDEFMKLVKKYFD